MSTMPPFLFIVASTNPADVSNGLLSVLSSNIAAIITGTFTLLAVWATAHQGHRKRYLEWTWDKAFVAFTDLDRAHREVIHGLTSMATAYSRDGFVSHNVEDEVHADQRRLTNTIAQCALLSRSEEVQDRLADLHSATREVSSYVHSILDGHAHCHGESTNHLQELVQSANRERQELSEMLNGKLHRLTKE